MSPFHVVLDTNVLVAALRSKRGASYRLLSLLGDHRCDFIITCNKKDFHGIRQFGIEALSSKEFLETIGEPK